MCNNKIMTARLFSIAIATTFLASCTPMEQEKHYNYHHGASQVEQPQDQQKSIIPIADPRGVNMNMMDYRLQEMVAEANDIEKQVSMLIDRLSNLREEISGLALVNKVSVKANPYPDSNVKPAPITPMETMAEPAAGKIELPVPERPVAKEKTTHHSDATAVPVKQKNVEPKPVSASKDGVTNVRYGIHSNKTRLVFDINGSTENELNYDSEAGIVTLKLPKTDWATAEQRVYNLAQISGYEAKKTNEGTVVAMAVQNTSSVKADTIAASAGKPSRLVIDLIK